jgi:Ca2+-binding RTX toxin-like protein
MTLTSRRRRRATIAALAATIAAPAVLASGAAAANAGTAAVAGGTISYEAVGNVANRLRVDVGNTAVNEYRLADAAGTIALGSGCRRESQPFPSVVCATTITDPSVEISLGDENDTAALTMRSFTDSVIELGAGDDVADFLSAGRTVLHGRAGDDTVRPSIFVPSGLFGPATVFGEGGRDTLTGGREDDTLRGGIGADKLTGGLGGDLIEGGLNADEIFADDGVADTIDCGDGLFDGPDSADVDALDDVSDDCEDPS